VRSRPVIADADESRKAEDDRMEHAVLLIDDDENLLRGLARALRQQPYRIYTAMSGEEAILVVKSRRIGVVVADELMPGMRGGDLLAWIAAHCPEVMRIVLTGHPTIDTAMRAINEGRVYQYLTKPCNPVHLGVAIRKALEHNDLVAENRRLMDRNTRHAEERRRCRAELAMLSEIVARYIQAPLQGVGHTRRSPENGEWQTSADSSTMKLIDQAIDASAEIQRIMHDLMDRSNHDR
jgi:two-component system, probable response regulator PhcQ